jgi:hypothetical protein
MLPLPNDSGFVRLMADTVLLDTLLYRSNMHHVLLDDVEGISLERSSDGSFTSTSTVLRATPGRKNSIVVNNGEPSNFDKTISVSDSIYNFYLESSVTSVYNAEFPQRVTLHYRFQESARVTAKIYTLSGFSVYTIIESELLQGEGTFYWDGRDETSSILPVGMYVIVLEIYAESGEYYVKKMPVAIAP